MNKLRKFIAQAIKDWFTDNSFRNSAALSFYIILALPALALSLISLSSLILGSVGARHEFTQFTARALGNSGQVIIQELVPDESDDSNFNIAKIVSIVILAISASGIFGQLQTSLNEIWNVELKPITGWRGFKQKLFNKFLLFLMVIFLSTLIVISLIIESIVALGSHFISQNSAFYVALSQSTSAIISFVLMVASVAFIYKYLPAARIKWIDATLGAIITTILITLGKYAIAWYLGWANLGSVYGTAGSIVVLISSIYYSSLVFFLGAEVTQNFANTYGRGIQPGSHARSTSSWKSFILKKLGR